MKLMRHKRTGKSAVYDQSLVDGGNWEAFPAEDAVPSQQTEQKPGVDNISVSDEVTVKLERGNGESIKRKA